MPADKSATKGDAPAQASSRKKLIIGIVVVAVLAIGGGAAWFMLGGKDEEVPVAEGAEPTGKLPAPAHYIALDPVFVTNVVADDGSSRYLQADVQLMTRDPRAVASMELHAPAIRARLLLLFSQQRAENLQTRAGKEKLQAAALTEVRKVLVEETGKPGAEALLFTSFVLQ